MNIENYLENVWNEKMAHYINNDLQNNELILADEKCRKLTVRHNFDNGTYMVCYESRFNCYNGWNCAIFRDSYECNCVTFIEQMQAKCEKDDSYDIRFALYNRTYASGANYYFQQSKTQFMQHCIKQVVFSWIQEYYNNPHNYIDNNMQLTTAELLIANEYIMGIVEKY